VRGRKLLRRKHLGSRQADLGTQGGYGRRLHEEARLPVELVFAVEFERVEAAYEFEKQVQGWSRAKRQALIRGDWDALPDLSKWRFRPSIHRPDSHNPRQRR
jgi:hypothetical protein